MAKKLIYDRVLGTWMYVVEDLSGTRTGVTVVSDIKARDKIKDPLGLIWVLDATQDPSVTKGSAIYGWNKDELQWIKIGEEESLDQILIWDNIQDKPQSGVEEIDTAVESTHTHDNKSVIDLLERSPGGELIFDGKTVGIADVDELRDQITQLGSSVRSLSNTLSGKVDKIAGKSLSANDYTDVDKAKLQGLSNLSAGDNIEITPDGKINAIVGNISDSVPCVVTSVDTVSREYGMVQKLVRNDENTGWNPNGDPVKAWFNWKWSSSSYPDDAGLINFFPFRNDVTDIQGGVTFTPTSIQWLADPLFDKVLTFKEGGMLNGNCNMDRVYNYTYSFCAQFDEALNGTSFVVFSTTDPTDPGKQGCELLITVNTEGIRFQWRRYDNGQLHTSNGYTFPRDTNWHVYTITADEGSENYNGVTNQFFYRDGIYLAESNGYRMLFDNYYNKLRVGDSGAGGERYLGKLCNLMFYNRKLSASEVQQIYLYQINGDAPSSVAKEYPIPVVGQAGIYTNGLFIPVTNELLGPSGRIEKIELNINNLMSKCVRVLSINTTTLTAQVQPQMVEAGAWVDDLSQESFNTPFLTAPDIGDRGVVSGGYLLPITNDTTAALNYMNESLELINGEVPNG